MCPRNDSYDDFDDTEDFAFGRSRALQRLLDDCRREERHQKQHRNLDRSRYHRDPWDWEDDDDWDSYLDGGSDDILKELKAHY